MRRTPHSDNAREAIDASSLDPVDWSAFRNVAHQLLDTAIDQLEFVEEQPVWQAMPDGIRKSLSTSLPTQPCDLNTLHAELKSSILPFRTGNIHPQFFGWVHGAGAPIGIVAEMLSAAMNCNVGGRDHVGVELEQAVIGWAKQLFGFPPEASGILLSGTSMATFVGLAVARQRALGKSVRQLGNDCGKAPLVAITSQAAHSSVARAFELLGLGTDSLVSVAVDPHDRIDIAELKQAIAVARSKGQQPFALIATAGTVNTGAIDSLVDLDSICRDEHIWLHVDAAFAGSLALHPSLRKRLAGIELADSIAFDFHKWMQVPYDAGCLLVKDSKQHHATFAARPDYLAQAARGLAAANTWMCDYGPELSRGLRALKIWMTFRHYGVEALGTQVAKNIDQAQWLAEQIESSHEFIKVGVSPLNIVCFQYRREGLNSTELNELNAKIVEELHESGIAAPSTTRIGHQLAIRVCITNHRTRREHLERLLKSAAQIGASLADQLSGKQLSTVAGFERKPQTIQSRWEYLIRVDSNCSSSDKSETFIQELKRALEDPRLTGLDLINRINFTASSNSQVGITQRRELLFHASGQFTQSSCRFWLRFATEYLSWMGENPYRTISERVAFSCLAIRAAIAEVEEAHTELARIQPTDGAAALLLALLNRRVAEWSDLQELEAATLHLIALTSPHQTRKECAEELATFDWTVFQSIVESGFPLAAPLHQLLASGGDDRIRSITPDEKNKYGCRTYPDNDLCSFSSSTATSISEEMYNHLWQVLQTLRKDAQHRSIDVVARTLRSSIVDNLLACLQIETPQSIDVALSASGTDAELLTVALAESESGRSIHNILLSPDESGSGLRQAASGRHPSRTTAAGNTVEVGTLIGHGPNDPLNEFEITSAEINARDSRGALRSDRSIIQDIEFEIERAVSQDKLCLVHALHCSKTGWNAPSRSELVELCRHYGNHVRMVVDVCQLRLTSADVCAWLEAGAWVQVTGSKFLGGPPFCGALIIPHRAEPPRLPASLTRLYVTGSDLPSSWLNANRSGLAAPNLGLLLRWEGAIHSFQKLNPFASEDIAFLLDNFRDYVAGQLAEGPLVTPLSISDKAVESNPLSHLSDMQRSVESLFPFAINVAGPNQSPQWLNVNQARTFQLLMKRDLSHVFQHDTTSVDTKTLGTRFHLGQPVGVTIQGVDSAKQTEIGMLRLSVSAEWVVARLKFRLAYPTSSMKRSFTDVDQAISKAKWIACHWHELNSADNNILTHST